ncbi:MAG: zinc-ribbon domain-containing protein [bacterium]|nr:MAG: zinc-ribbon domain-containing protein [bacterium]
MTKPEKVLPFPFSSILMNDTPPEPSIFDRILRGEGDLAALEYGYCVTSEEHDAQRHYLLFFQRKPYAAGVFSGPDDILSTTVRDFFVYIAQHPKTRLQFMATDPILVKSILVLQECTPETQGSAEFLRIENQVVGLMEGRKDALVALVQDDRFSLAFAKSGKVARAYFYDQFVESSSGMEWLDLFKRIETYQVKGQRIRIMIYEDMSTRPAEDYLEGSQSYHGGVFKHYTRPLPELIIRDKIRTLKRISVHKFPFVIGRSDEADLVLGDAGVSRKHAALEDREGKVVVRDLGSLNGIFVNDHFTKEFALQDGDKITVGSHILQVVLPRSPAEDVQLVDTGSQEATMAMDREARIKITCPKCGAAGSLEAKRLYSKKKVRIRCPKCGDRFDPLR